MGPESARSTPGTACYGRGGVKPTITDATVAATLIGHGQLGYGAVTADQSAARAAIAPLAARLGATVEETAASIVEVAVSAMYAEVSGLISRFGIDPRDFHLVAFGGAGAMLHCFLARELDMKGVVVSPTPGVVSALGGLIADLRNDFIRRLFVDLDHGTTPLVAPLTELEATGRDWLAAQGYDGPVQISVSADTRYAGQSYEIETPLQPGWITAGETASVASAFHAEHARLFGHARQKASIQIVNLRLVASGATPKPVARRPAAATEPVTPTGQITGWFDGQPHQTPLFARASLLPGHRLTAPAIVIQADTTTVIPPGFVLDVDAFGNLVISAPVPA